MKTTIKILFAALILVTAGLACSLPFTNRVEATPIPISTEAVAEAASLVEAWDQAIQTAKESGNLDLTLTEAQMTSFLAVSMAERPEIPVTNLRIDLREGEMEVTGTYKNDAISADVSIVMEVAVDADGSPSVNVTSGSIGVLPVPAELLSGISDAVNEALTGQAASTSTGFTLTAITITEGQITLSGTLQQ